MLILALTGAWPALQATQAQRQVAQDRPSASPDESWLASLERWRALVDAYGSSLSVNDLMALAAWQRRDLDAVIGDFGALLDLLNGAYSNAAKARQGFTITYKSHVFLTGEVERLLGLSDAEARGRNANRILKRAALLHTDVALLVAPGAGPSASGPESSVILVADGRPAGFGSPMAHLVFARALLDRVAPRPGDDAMVRLWYRAIAAFLARESKLADASSHLRRAQEIFPADAATLFAIGCLHEAMAAPGIQAGVRDLQLPPGRKAGVGPVQFEIDLAESYFRQALKADPSLTEARVRIARLKGLQGDHRGAATDLRQVAQSTVDAALLYFTWLFLGNEEEALGRRDAARDAYRRAAALFPQAQSPLLALSQLARRSGDRAGALDAVRHVLALPASEDERIDPWWIYHAGPGRYATSLLGELRKAFLAGSRP